MQPAIETEPLMTPRDIPGRLEIQGLFPWLEHLVPAQEPSELDPAATASTLRPAAVTEPAPADLPRAA
jgi:hypothetical protein